MGNFIVKNTQKVKSTTVCDEQNPTKMHTAEDSRKPPRSGLVQWNTLRKKSSPYTRLGYHNAKNSNLQFDNFISCFCQLEMCSLGSRPYRLSP